MMETLHQPETCENCFVNFSFAFHVYDIFWYIYKLIEIKQHWIFIIWLKYYICRVILFLEKKSIQYQETKKQTNDSMTSIANKWYYAN